jgi:hypothetical protein
MCLFKTYEPRILNIEQKCSGMLGCKVHQNNLGGVFPLAWFFLSHIVKI